MARFQLLRHLPGDRSSLVRSTGVAPGDISRANVAVIIEPVGPGSSLPGTCFPGIVLGSGYDAVLTVTCDFDDILVNTYIVQANVTTTASLQSCFIKPRIITDMTGLMQVRSL